MGGTVAPPPRGRSVLLLHVAVLVRPQVGLARVLPVPRHLHVGGGDPAEFLKPAVSPDGSARMGPDDSSLRAGRGDFDATGKLPCAQHAGQPMTQCEFGVARAGGGYATVVISKPDGLKRAIFYRMGIAIGADTSEADPGEFSAARENDLYFIRVGHERYEIPDAVVLGG